MRGVYLLCLRVLRKINLRVGSLGVVEFLPGIYVYVGSAQVGLEERVRRHASKTKKRHWHIDYLTGSRWVRVAGAYVYPLPKRYECILASKLREVGEAVPGFGASDCGCSSHLIKIGEERLNDVITETSRLNPRSIELR